MTWLCKIIGCHWREKYYTYSADHMWRYINYRHFKHCTRCSKPNPNIEN